MHLSEPWPAVVLQGNSIKFPNIELMRENELRGATKLTITSLQIYWSKRRRKKKEKKRSKIMMIKLRPIKRSLGTVVSISFVCCWIFVFSCWSHITVNEALCIYCDSLYGILTCKFLCTVQSLNINCPLAFFCLKYSWSSSSRHATNTPHGRSSNDAYDGASTTWHDARWAW